MPTKIRKFVSLTQELWEKIEEQRIKENRSSYHNMIDTMIKAYFKDSLIEVTTLDSKKSESVKDEMSNRSLFGSIKYDPNKIKL